jgi:hypothetical protein
MKQRMLLKNICMFVGGKTVLNNTHELKTPHSDYPF